MVRPRHQQIAPSLHRRCFRGVKELQAIHVFQVECQIALRSVNLEAIAIATANPKPAGFKATQAAISELRHQQRSVFNVAPRHESVLHC